MCDAPPPASTSRQYGHSLQDGRLSCRALKHKAERQQRAENLPPRRVLNTAVLSTQSSNSFLERLAK